MRRAALALLLDEPLKLEPLRLLRRLALARLLARQTFALFFPRANRRAAFLCGGGGGGGGGRGGGRRARRVPGGGGALSRALAGDGRGALRGVLGAGRGGAGGFRADELGSLGDETASRALESARAARLVREGLVASRAHPGVARRVVEVGGILVPRRPARVGGALVATREVVGGPAGAVREGEGGARRGGEVDEGDEAIGERALGVRADPPDAHDRHQHAHRAEHRHPVGGERQDVLERRGIDGVDEIVRPLLRLAKGAERAALHRRPHPEHPRSTPLGRRCVTADLPCRGPPQTRWRPPPRYANPAEPRSFAVEPERPVVARAETSVASVTASRAAPRRMRPRHLPARRLRDAERQISPPTDPVGRPTTVDSRQRRQTKNEGSFRPVVVRSSTSKMASERIGTNEHKISNERMDHQSG